MADFSFLNDKPDDGTIRINTGATRRPARRPPPAKKREPSAAAGCLLALIVFGGCTYWVQHLPQTPPEQFDQADNRSLALSLAQSHVKGMLKAPRSAKWPSEWSDGDTRRHATKSRDGTYVVRSFVDSQNSFGAMIRTWYVVRLRVHPSGMADILEAEVLE